MIPRRTGDLQIDQSLQCRSICSSEVVIDASADDSVRMQSRREFKPPFRLETRAATDSTNIRFYYGDHLAILNWEVNPSELRMHHPATGQSVGIREMGH